MTLGWHNSDTTVTLDNDTRVTQEGRYGDKRVTLDWHMSDATVTEWWYNSAIGQVMLTILIKIEKCTRWRETFRRGGV